MEDQVCFDNLMNVRCTYDFPYNWKQKQLFLLPTETDARRVIQLLKSLLSDSVWLGSFQLQDLYQCVRVYEAGVGDLLRKQSQYRMVITRMGTVHKWGN